MKYRTLYFFQNKSFVDSNGVVTTVDSYEEFKEFMYKRNAMAIAIDNVVNFIWLDEAVHDLASTDVICDKHGTANMIRMRYKDRSTRWLVNFSLWSSMSELEKWGIDLCQFLVELDEFFHYLEVGTCITPGSAGHKSQMIVHQNHHYPKQTCISIGMENFLRKHCISGPIITTKTGEFQESLMMDGSGYFLAYWTVLPEKAGIWIDGDKGSDPERFATYFCKCTIIVPRTLPVGVFPIRGKNGRIKYPTEKGVYYEVYLWKEQVTYVRAQGCQAYVHGGIAWTTLCGDSWDWSSWIYWKRKHAKTEAIAGLCKRAAVGGIGHHGMQRSFYRLVPDEGEVQGTLVTTFNDDGEPLCYVAIETDAMSEPYLLHKQRYCAAMAALGSLQFAWDFAIEGRLIQVYHDSCLILEKDESHEYVMKKSNEALEMPPGTWMWERLTDVTVFKNGDVDSNEYKRVHHRPVRSKK